MSDEKFELLLKMTTPEEARRVLKDVERWFEWMLWRQRHPTLAAILDGAYWAGVMMVGR
jgi:hypothetical protein